MSMSFPEPDDTDITAHVRWFAEYAARERAKEDADPAPMDLKRRHTLEVLANARRIVAGGGVPPRLARACLLAALYHDVGRFEQYVRYHTFRDGESCDHGRQGVLVLKKERPLACEAPRLRLLVQAGVALHNRFALPTGADADAALVTNVVRDADKLDILRVIAEHLSGPGPYHPTVVLQQPDDPAIASPAVLEAVRRHEVAHYGDLNCLNDFRLLLGTWFDDLHFRASRRQFLGDGHAVRILRGIPDAAPQRAMRDLLLTRLREAACEGA